MLYKADHRRRRRRKVWPLILAVLFFLLLLLAAFYFLSERIVFTEDGFRFITKFTDPTEPIEPTDPTEPLDIVIESPTEPTGTSAPTQATEPPDPMTDAPYTAAIWVDPDRVLDSAYVSSVLAIAAENGLNCAVIPIKDHSGVVRIPAQSDFFSGNTALSADAPAFLEALDAFRDAELHLIAVISVCRDGIMPRSFRADAASTPNALWLDAQYVPWFSPYRQTAADYLCDLLAACADAGFDEVLLDNMHFANYGRTNLISYGNEPENGRYDAVDALAARARDKAGELGLVLSALLTSDAANELRDDLSGQDVRALAPYFSKLYVRAQTHQEGAYSALSNAILTANADCRLSFYLTASQPPVVEDGYNPDYVIGVK